MEILFKDPNLRKILYPESESKENAIAKIIKRSKYNQIKIFADNILSFGEKILVKNLHSLRKINIERMLKKHKSKNDYQTKVMIVLN